MNKNDNWEKRLRDAKVIWQHDGDLRRPFVRLTSGTISSDFLDFSYAMAFPAIIHDAAKELARALVEEYPKHYRKLVICGQQKGSTTLASSIAEQLGCGFVFTDKDGEGASKEMVLDERFSGIHPHTAMVVLVEDVATSALTSHKSREALKKAGFTTISNLLLAMADRTGGSNEFGFDIIACYVPHDLRQWKEGKNPFTPDGKEVVTPVRAKTAEGRRLIHQA